MLQAYSAAITERKAASAAAASGSSGAGAVPEGLKLEPESALLVPGKKAGEMKVIQEGGGGVVYTWDDAKYAFRLKNAHAILPEQSVMKRPCPCQCP